MSDVLPPARPKLTREAAQALLTAVGITGPAILGKRGYYLDSMGVAGKNDRGIFDDMLAIVTPRKYVTFNGNTDPSSSGGRLASLVAGVYQFKKGIHHPYTPLAYPCLVQAGPVTVLRDNGVRESGEFYIHVHHAGYNTTTSAGCQTIYRPQWDEFWSTVVDEMDFYDLSRIPYLLTEQANA